MSNYFRVKIILVIELNLYFSLSAFVSIDVELSPINVKTIDYQKYLVNALSIASIDTFNVPNELSNFAINLETIYYSCKI